jgi:hypothetical protein
VLTELSPGAVAKRFTEIAGALAMPGEAVPLSLPRVAGVEKISVDRFMVGTAVSQGVCVSRHTTNPRIALSSNLLPRLGHRRKWRAPFRKAAEKP